MIKPRPLRPGDPVALIAPSSPVSEEKIELSIQSIRFLGLEPIVFPSCFMKNGYLSGRDEARAKDVNDAFVDPDIRGIFCVRGGYGTTRILPMLDYEGISAIQKFCRLWRYHSPALYSTSYADSLPIMLPCLQEGMRNWTLSL